RNLIQSEIFQRQSRADVERRLIQIGYEQVCFSGIGDGQRQAMPGALRVKRSQVVPRAEQTEYLAGVGQIEEPINLINSPDNRCVFLGKDLAPQIAFKVNTGTQIVLPHLVRFWGQVELICD